MAAEQLVDHRSVEGLEVLVSDVDEEGTELDNGQTLIFPAVPEALYEELSVVEEVDDRVLQLLEPLLYRPKSRIERYAVFTWVLVMG